MSSWGSRHNKDLAMVGIGRNRPYAHIFFFKREKKEKQRKENVQFALLG